MYTSSSKYIGCNVFREGYLRTSSSEYTTDKKNLENEYVHLTNNAVQKNASNYGKFEDGNQLSFADLQRIVTSEIGSKPDSKLP